MHSPYREECRGCPLARDVSEPTKGGDLDGLRYINCLRDNEDAKKRLEHTQNDEDYLYLRQVGELHHCIYDYKNTSVYGGDDKKE
jgi:hypothetical protein